MRKPIKLTKYKSGIFDTGFSTVTLEKPIEIVPIKDDVQVEVEMEGAIIVHNPQSDWAQNDPEKVDYIKNKYIAEQYRPVIVNGETYLSEARESGPLNIVGEGGIIITPDSDSLTFSVEDYVEGDAIDIINNEEGKKVISVEPGSINDTHIDALSIGKITQNLGEKIIIYGGNANGWN